MSSREHLITKAMEAIDAESDAIDTTSGNVLVNYARAAVDALLPLIERPGSMRGVPEGSILLVEIQAGARALRWEDGFLHGNLRADGMPMTADWVIERYGPLTVVWMP